MSYDFANISQQWWDPDGPMRPLHDLTPIRGQFILQHLSKKPKTAIDFGCGAGILTEWLAEQNYTCIGVEQSQELVDTAKRHAKLSGLDIEYICANNLSKCKKTELITCMEVLEHCPDPEAIIAMFAQKLNKNGILCLSTINNTWTAFLKVIVAAEYLMQMIPKGTHKKSDFIQPSKIIRAAMQHNLELITAKGIEYLPHSRTGRLTDDLSCNYILAFRKL